jgi:serine/threonine protein kinase
MKYLDGGSLAERVRLSPFSEDQALQITREISSALKSIHSNGLLHLDIKPANILFDSQNRAVLIDFGISKYVDGQNDTTSSSSLIGFSRGFAPLEQINANMSSLSPASDIYSLGATLYNMVVGSAPPDATLVMDAGLPAFPAGISEDVQHAIEMAMQPRRKDRPQDIDAFLDLLPEEDFSDEDENTIVAVRQDTAKSDPSTKSKWLFYTALVLFVGAAVLAGVTFFQKSRTMASGSENKQLEQMENKVQALITKNDSLQQQMTVMKRQASNSDQSKKQLDDLQKKNADLSSQITSLRKENTNLKTQVSVYKTEAENNKADAEKWRRQLNANSRR